MSNSLNRLLKTAEIISISGDISLFNSFCVQFEAFIKKNIVKAAHMEPKNDGTVPNPFRRNMDYSGWEGSPYFGSVSEFLERFPGGIREWVEWKNSTKKERFQKWDPKNTKSRVAYLENLMKFAEDNYEENLNELLDYKRSLLEGLYDLEERWINADGNLEEEARIEKITRNVRNKLIEIKKEIKELQKTAHFEPVGPDNTKDFPKEPHIYSGDNVGEYESIKEYLDKKRKVMNQEADDISLARDAAQDFVNYYKLLLKKNKKRK